MKFDSIHTCIYFCERGARPSVENEKRIHGKLEGSGRVQK